MKTILCILLWLVFACVNLLAQPWSDVTLAQPYTNAAAGGGGDGPNVWYYAGSGKTETNFTSQTSSGWAPQTYNYGANITVAASGTCTSISIKAGCDVGTNLLKIALFDSSNNLAATGSVGLPESTISWHDVTVSAAVTSGTYYIMGSFQNVNGTYATDAGQDGIYDEVAYASFPAATATPTTESGTIYGVRMYVD